RSGCYKRGDSPEGSSNKQLPWLGDPASLSARRRQGHLVGGLATGAEDAPKATAPGGRIEATPQSSMGSAANPEFPPRLIIAGRLTVAALSPQSEASQSR